MKQTVKDALQEVVLLTERRTHAARLASMEGLDLGNDEVMADTWR